MQASQLLAALDLLDMTAWGYLQESGWSFESASKAFPDRGLALHAIYTGYYARIDSEARAAAEAADRAARTAKYIEGKAEEGKEWAGPAEWTLEQTDSSLWKSKGYLTMLSEAMDLRGRAVEVSRISGPEGDAAREQHRIDSADALARWEKNPAALTEVQEAMRSLV